MMELIRQPLTPTESQSLQTEIKYVAPTSRTQLTLRILEKTCDLDPKFPFGIVSSIYYDTQNWDFLREKRNSDYLKTKIRLRWYDQTPASNDADGRSYAEIKYRIGSKRMKIRLPTQNWSSFCPAQVMIRRTLVRTRRRTDRP